MGKTLKVTLKSPDGLPLGNFLVDLDEVNGSGNGNGRPPVAGEDNEEKMTTPQRRYLFRLLAVQGTEGKAAEEHLKEYFRVKSLADVPKLAASGYIDMLVKGQKGGGA